MSKLKKHHKEWLEAIRASYTGAPISFDYLGITPQRLQILEKMGLIEFSGKYKLTEEGLKVLNK